MKHCDECSKDQLRSTIEQKKLSTMTHVHKLGILTTVSHQNTIEEREV